MILKRIFPLSGKILSPPIYLPFPVKTTDFEKKFKKLYDN